MELLSIIYEEDGADYDSQLQALDQDVRAHAVELKPFCERAAGRIRAMHTKGAFITKAPRVPNPRFVDERDMPWGPNTAELAVEYWEGEPGMGTPREIRISFIQEFEDWRIDGITPDILKEQEP